MSDSQPDRASGGVPHTFRLRMAWQWVPRMPPELRRRKAFLNALQTVAALADTAGRTRFQDNGRPIRITQLADAMGSREKDARRYLAAAIAAGILTTEEAPRRGRTTVYVLLVPPGTPRWAAALAVLEVGETSGADNAQHTPAEAEFGRRMPEPAPAAQVSSSGDDRPNSTPVTAGQVRATGARPSSGDGWTLSSGAGSPNNPGVPKINPQEMVSVGPQVRDACAQETHERASDHSPSPPGGAGPSPLRVVPAPLPGTRARGRAPQTPQGQPPLLMPVPAPARPAARPAYAPAGDQSIGAPPDGWRARVARERPEDAAAVYRDRWTGEHACHLPDATGT